MLRWGIHECLITCACVAVSIPNKHAHAPNTHRIDNIHACLLTHSPTHTHTHTHTYHTKKRDLESDRNTSEVSPINSLEREESQLQSMRRMLAERYKQVQKNRTWNIYTHVYYRHCKTKWLTSESNNHVFISLVFSYWKWNMIRGNDYTYFT